MLDNLNEWLSEEEAAAAVGKTVRTLRAVAAQRGGAALCLLRAHYQVPQARLRRALSTERDQPRPQSPECHEVTSPAPLSIGAGLLCVRARALRALLRRASVTHPGRDRQPNSGMCVMVVVLHFRTPARPAREGGWLHARPAALAAIDVARFIPFDDLPRRASKQERAP